MKPTGTRQQGKFNESKDKRKNRNLNKKANADVIEDAADIRNAKSVNRYDEAGVLIKNGNVCTGTRSNLLDGGDNLPIISESQQTVEAARPREPSWFQKSQAFAPSRSYLKKTDEDT